ncbi:MAG: peptidylprolyl isomerase [Terriglobales bacterium]|jgi:peptidyl-prolyl cis-trans isomerase A (cyclophilin A)
MIFFLLTLLSLVHPGTPAIQSGSSNPAGTVVVVLETELGQITIAVDMQHAPITSANFLKYVDGGFYNGGEFHRTVRRDNEVRKDAPIEVIQARINPARASEGFPPIPIERTSVTGLKHLDGTVSMARDVTPTAPGPDTATSGIFICIGDQPSLNFAGKRSPDGQGFAAFGKVVSGMDVVKRIHESPAPKDTPATKNTAQGQTLVPTIKILRVYRK